MVRNRILLAALAAGTLLATGCRPKPVERQVPLEPIIGNIDVPRPGQVLDGHAIIAGWAVAKSGIAKMALYIDRQFVDFVVGGGPRPDVAQLFPGYPGAKQAAWSVTLDPTRMAEGNHEIILEVRSKGGAVHEVGPVPFEWRVSSREAAYQVPLEPILGELDTPHAGATVKGPLMVVGGWAIAETGVRRVAIYVDGQFVLFDAPSVKRPDIGKNYPAFPGSGQAGWTTAVSTNWLSDGEHRIVAQVKAKSGAVRNFGPVTVRVVH